MSSVRDEIAKADDLWEILLAEARSLSASTPSLRKALQSGVLQHSTFSGALGSLLAQSLAHTVPREVDLQELFSEVLAKNPEITHRAAFDLEKLNAVNPACPNVLIAFISFRGFQALQLYRITHALYHEGSEQLAVALQNWGALKYSMDIHPAARIGRSVFLDHGIGVVIGSTAVIEDGVNMWHGVTLGSTLTETGDRHPKIRRNATICASATILGNIEVGEGAIVAAGSVVLKSVPPMCTVAGVPAKVIGRAPAELATIAPISRHSAETREN